MTATNGVPGLGTKVLLGATIGLLLGSALAAAALTWQEYLRVHSPPHGTPLPPTHVQPASPLQTRPAGPVPVQPVSPTRTSTHHRPAPPRTLTVRARPAAVNDLERPTVRNDLVKPEG